MNGFYGPTFQQMMEFFYMMQQGKIQGFPPMMPQGHHSSKGVPMEKECSHSCHQSQHQQSYHEYPSFNQAPIDNEFNTLSFASPLQTSKKRLHAEVSGSRAQQTSAFLMNSGRRHSQNRQQTPSNNLFLGNHNQTAQKNFLQRSGKRMPTYPDNAQQLGKSIERGVSCTKEMHSPFTGQPRQSSLVRIPTSQSKAGSHVPTPDFSTHMKSPNMNLYSSTKALRYQGDVSQERYAINDFESIPTRKNRFMTKHETLQGMHGFSKHMQKQEHPEVGHSKNKQYFNMILQDIKISNNENA